MDHYSILGVTQKATSDEIRKSYLKIAKTHHPDKTKDVLKNNKFKSALEAYSVLMDPGTRVQYDLTLVKSQKVAYTSTASTATYTTATTNSVPTFSKHPNYKSKTQYTKSSASSLFEGFGSTFTKNPNKFTNFKPSKTKKIPTTSSAAAAAFQAFYQKQQTGLNSSNQSGYNINKNRNCTSNSNQKNTEKEEDHQPTKEEVPLPQNWQRQETHQFKYQSTPPKYPDKHENSFQDQHHLHQNPYEHQESNKPPTTEPDFIEISDNENEDEVAQDASGFSRTSSENISNPLSDTDQSSRNDTPESNTVEMPNINNKNAKREEKQAQHDTLRKPHPKKVKLQPLEEEEEDLWSRNNGLPKAPPSHSNYRSTSNLNFMKSRQNRNRSSLPSTHQAHTKLCGEEEEGLEGDIKVEAVHDGTFQTFKKVLDDLEHSEIFNDKPSVRSPKRVKLSNGNRAYQFKNFKQTPPFTETIGNFLMDDLNVTINESPSLSEICLSGVDPLLFDPMYLDPTIQQTKTIKQTMTNPLDADQWYNYKKRYQKTVQHLNEVKYELLTISHKRMMKDAQYHLQLLNDSKTSMFLVAKDSIILAHLSKIQELLAELVKDWNDVVVYRFKFGMKSS